MADEVATLIFKAETGELVKAEAIIKRIGSEGKKSERASDGLARGLKRTAVALVSIGTATLAIKKLVSAGRSFDILNAQLVTATGSAENAKIAFGALEDFAAKTPFQLDEVTEAFVKMRNLGLDPSEAALTSYGNTASAMGKSLNQMVEAVADAATGEFERLKEFGIKASSQGDQVAFTFQGVTTTVKKNAEEISGYLRNIGDVNFAGAMDARAATLDGAISNLEDSWNSLWMSASSNGAGDIMAEQIRELSALLSDPETVEAATTLATAIISAFSTVVDTLATTINVVRYLGEELAAAIHGPAVGDIVRIEEELLEKRKAIEEIEKRSRIGRQTGSNEAAAAALRAEISELERKLTISQELAGIATGRAGTFTVASGVLDDGDAEGDKTDVLGQFKIENTDEGGDSPITQSRQNELDKLRQSFMEEDELENTRYKTKLDLIANFLSDKQILEAEAKEMELQAEIDHAENLQVIKDEKWNEENQWMQDGLSMADKYYAGMQGKEAAYMRAGIKAAEFMADAKKRTALKGALVKGYESIQTAAALPFPANIPAVAFATGQMAFNVGGIMGVAHGGLDNVPREGTYLLEQGEAVLAPNQNKDLKAFLAGAKNGESGSNSSSFNEFNINIGSAPEGQEATEDMVGMLIEQINERSMAEGRGEVL